MGVYSVNSNVFDIFVAVAFGLSLLASVYPAWRAAQVPPAEVLNYV